MSKFLDNTGLTHFWGKIKTLLAGKADKESLDNVVDLVNTFNSDLSDLYRDKADRNHTHNDSVKIETPQGDVAEIVAYTDSETGYASIETGRFHSTSAISAEGDISAEGRIVSQSFDFDMAGDRCIWVDYQDEIIKISPDGYTVYVDGTFTTLELNTNHIYFAGENADHDIYPRVDETSGQEYLYYSGPGFQAHNIFAAGEVDANMARVDEVDFKMCDNNGDTASPVLMYGYYDENDERHLIVEEINQLDVTGSIKADGEIYEEGIPLSDKYALKGEVGDIDGNLYVGGVLDADAGICIGGEYLHEIFAEVNHTHSGIHKFKLLGRQTLAANGVADLSTYLAAYDELMIIVRTQSSASVTIGPANNTSGSSGFLCSKSVTGTIYTKIMVNKTDEGYMAWDVGGNVGWSNSTAYKYLRNYVASGTVSMSVVVHGR